MDEHDFKRQIAIEAKQARDAGKAFASACADSDVDAFFKAVNFINDRTVDGWRHAMLHVSRLPRVSDEIKAAFMPVWVESKMLALTVGHRPTLARGLRVLMPGSKRQKPVRLFRGAGWLERQRRLYGFSWSTRRAVAVYFAKNWETMSPGGVVLMTVATPDAVLLDRERDSDGYNDEGEIVVDPFRLGRVSVDLRLADGCADRSP